MRKWMTFINNQSLRNRLIAWFLLIATLPVVWTTVISYFVCKHILFNQATKNLRVLAHRQEELLKYYLHEKELDASEFSKDPKALEAMQTLQEVLARYGKNSPEYQIAKLRFYPILHFRVQALNYQDLWLINKEGIVVFSIATSLPIGQNIHSDKYTYLENIVEKSMQTSQIQMASLVFNRDKSSFTSFIAIPIFSRNNQLLGAALVELNNIALSQMAAGYKELGLARVLVATRLENSLFVFDPTQVNQKRSEEINIHSSFGRFIETTLNQHYAEAINIPFKGHKNLMVGKQLYPNANWALLTTINEDKLLQPIYQLQYLFAILVTGTALAVIFAASHIAKKISSPILTLTEKTNILASGDLSQRITITSKDEIGRLGESFNIMASKLNHLINHLDDLVAKRTQQYQIQNVKLEQTIKALQQTRDRLITQEKLASLGALTAGIAHEIKNPLNFIINFAELSLQLEKEIEEHIGILKSPLSEDQKKDLEELFNTLQINVNKIIEHGKRADSIIFNMLQHSRGTPGEKRSINLHQLLDEYIALSYHGMRAQDASFNVTMEKDYDSSIPPISVVPQEISRVIINLLNNAYYSVTHKKKQSSSPSYQPKIKVSTTSESGDIVIKIWDNGWGIPPEVFPKLFTPFFSTKPPGEGTGLGLSLSYNIITQGHGGTLSVTSQPGEFAEFKITLPYS